MSGLVVNAFGVTAAGLAASWLILSGHSPLAGWVVGMPLVTNLFSLVNLPTFIFAMAGFPGTRPPPEGAIAFIAVMQWLAYGFVAAWGWGRLRPSP